MSKYNIKILNEILERPREREREREKGTFFKALKRTLDGEKRHLTCGPRLQAEEKEGKGKFSFRNRTIENWNMSPASLLRTLLHNNRQYS